MGTNFIRVVAICVLFLATACTERLGKNLIVVLPDENGKVGAVAVSDGEKEILLDTANSAAKIGRDGKVEPVVVTDKDINTIFGSTLKGMPITPTRFRLYFVEGTDELTAESQAQIDDVLAATAKRSTFDVEVTGHTDTVGEEEFNSKLSLKRAHKLRDLLVEKGIAADVIYSYGRGEWDLYIVTEDGVREPKNRRVEIIIR
jgi:outer membrane protein OmpA-like peptidoglycan-associated protein